MSMVNLTCEVCGLNFERKVGEFRRNKKLGRRVCCSLKCVGKTMQHNLASGDYDISYHSGNRGDEFSKFRWFLARAKQRMYKHVVDITLNDLKEQWEKQNGICPFTGWKIKLMDDTGHRLPLTPDRASLDRIDSSKGYIKGNIQYVSLMAQLAKNKWADEQLVEFCKAVAENKSAALS